MKYLKGKEKLTMSENDPFLKEFFVIEKEITFCMTDFISVTEYSFKNG